MGYTHYLRRPLEISTPHFTAIVSDTQIIFAEIERRGITLAGGLGTGKPIADNERIWFNGNEATGEDHETFYFYKKHIPERWEHPDKNKRLFTSCKTNRMPYDLAVCAVLMVIKDRLQQAVIIRSDGDFHDRKDWPEWLPAYELYENLFGKFRAQTARKLLEEDFNRKEE